MMQAMEEPDSIAPTNIDDPNAEQINPNARVFCNLWFDEMVWGFDPEFPDQLESVISEQEWRGIVDRLNNDLNQPVVIHWRRLERWVRICSIASISLVGVLLWPAVLIEIEIHKRLLRKYWKDVRIYLVHLGKQFDRRQRHLLWKLVVNEERITEKHVNMVPNYYRAISIEWSCY